MDAREVGHQPSRLTLFSPEAIKRCFDVGFAGIGLLIASPMLIAIAIAIKTDSQGPVFYRGVRTGRYGEPFSIIKFRSMKWPHDPGSPLTTAYNDPRLTRVGTFLRKYKLDELPQLLNVLVGHMSIVGPRPEMPEFTRLYRADQRIILSVRPGITDYASLEFVHLDRVVGSVDVDRNYLERVWPRKMQLRMHYVENHTLWMDIRIIVRTVARLVGAQ